jgi:hypothetical protein
MRAITATLLFLLFLMVLSLVPPSRADDLNDGIEADDAIGAYGEINGANKNFSYLAQRARSKAASGSGGVVLAEGGALNSVILDSGARINGDIIIIDDSKGDKTVISK